MPIKDACLVLELADPGKETKELERFFGSLEATLDDYHDRLIPHLGTGSPTFNVVRARRAPRCTPSPPRCHHCRAAAMPSSVPAAQSRARPQATCPCPRSRRPGMPSAVARVARALQRRAPRCLPARLLSPLALIFFF